MSEFVAARVNGLQPSPIREFFNHAPAGSINLGLGELQFSPHPLLQRFAAEEAAHHDGRYTPNAGLPELRDAVAQFHGAKTEQVCITSGAEEAIFAALTAIIDPGDKILVANPGYLAYAQIITLCGGLPVAFSLDPNRRFQLDRESFRQAVGARTKAVIFSHPSNPLGIHFPEEDLRWLGESYPELLFIVDEVYRQLPVGEDIPSVLGILPNLILISGVSKMFAMTGWRIGWTVSPSPLHEAIVRVHQYVSTCASKFSQRIAWRVLRDGEAIRQDILTQLHANETILREELLGVPCLPHTAAPYCFIKVGGDDFAWCRDALRLGAITVPGGAFGSNGGGWVRLNYALEASQLREGLQRLQPLLAWS